MFKAILLLTALLAMTSNVLAQEQEWRFRVYLDNKEIGYHNFTLESSESESRLLSEANFEYRLLFVKLYDYQHENTETWEDGCLKNIESRTDANGTQYEVNGTLKDGKFVLSGSAGKSELSDCNMSFAYWNPAFLQQDRLINVQTGEVLGIRVSEPERVELNVRGKSQPAFRYQLGAGEMKIDLWYSENNEWLALETDAKGGRRLRYQLL